jgi:hypothetical protein
MLFWTNQENQNIFSFKNLKKSLKTPKISSNQHLDKIENSTPSIFDKESTS